MAKRKIFPIVLILLGGAFVLGALFSWFDNLTAAEPVGLGKWIFDVLQFLVGTGAGIGGWLSLHKTKDESSRKIEMTDNSKYFEKIEHYHEAPRIEKPLSALNQLPQPPADFTGRELLITQLLEDFNSQRGATISGLIGMGGIGKTALGLVVAHKLAEKYPDAQIFLDLKGTTTPLSATDVMRHVILAFEPTADLRQLDDANMSAAYRSVLHGKKVLLFLDNARSAEQIAPLRPPETCAMLVTSRWTFAVPGLQSRRVDVMSADDAKKFLLEVYPRIGEHAANLAGACAYLPLALRIAGSFLQVNSNWSIEKYLSQLNDHKRRLEILKQSRAEAELTTEPDLLATFELSYNGLSEENRKRWRMLGVFPASFAASAAQAMWELEEEETTKLLGLLRHYSLLDFDPNAWRYSLHDLLIDFALSMMKNGEEARARIIHSVYFSKTLTTINQMYRSGGENTLLSLNLYDTEWINLETGQRFSAYHLEDNRDAAEACNNYALQGSINGLRQKPSDRIRWLSEGLKASKVLGYNNFTGHHLSNLGAAYSEMGDTTQAIEYYEQALAIARETGDRQVEANALGNLGVEFAELEEINKAIEHYEKALEIAREIGDRENQGGWLDNLGNAYSRLGDIKKAIELCEQALDIANATNNHLSKANVLGNLGLAYAELGNVSKALECYNNRIEISRKIGDRAGEALTLGNIGVIYAKLDDFHHAIGYFIQQHDTAREFGNRRIEVAALENLGTAYTNLGEIDKAIGCYEQASKIDRERGNRKGELANLDRLGNGYVTFGDVSRAVYVYEQQLSLLRESGSPQDQAQALAKLGFLNHQLQENAKGIEQIKEALQIFETLSAPQADLMRSMLKEWGALE